ncbi:uncharacterized protein [Argopecten irradians]|uniref:uncharacterized protein n=1 Tax=Argopecten irradians TaxID=31199 RepID=UPI003721407A
MLKNGSIYAILATCILYFSNSEIFRMFTCVTFNWNVNLTCSWIEPTNYGSDVTTNITWGLSFFGNRAFSKCPVRTRSSCSWGLGVGTSYDVDPDSRITVCLQLVTSHGVSAKECHPIDIADNVKPAAVSDIVAISTSPLCLNISWSHGSTIESKTYEMKLLSDQHQIVINVNSTEDPEHLDYAIEESCLVCNLSHYTSYMISVRTRPLNYNGNPTGYWSDSMTINKKTPKSVPARSPSLLPGAFTRSPTNVEGYSNVHLYWLALSRRSWNGDHLTYVINVTTLEPCRRQTKNLNRHEAPMVLEILSNCSYEVLVWAKNEVGQTNEPNEILIQDKGFAPPEDVFLNTTSQSGVVDISWKRKSDVTQYTVYWCQSSPSRSCATGFNHKTVKGNNKSTFVTLKGFPNISYIFGVSAEKIRNRKIISSGFLWTDCSTLLPNILQSPIIHFRGYPKDRIVSVTWGYSHCSDLIFRKLKYGTDYRIKIDTTVRQYNRIVPGNTNSIVLRNIPSGIKVCVTIATRLLSDRESPVTCYIQPEESDVPWGFVLGIMSSVVGLIVVIGAMCFMRKCCRWWQKDIPIKLPDVQEVTETLV